jgi:hypothetical protein
MLHSLRSALRPGGALVLIDFCRIPGRSRPWILSHVGAGREHVIGEDEDAGFELTESRELLRDNFYLRFGKPID